MQSAEVVLGVLRERGRKGLPCNELYRQLFNPQLYLLAYGRIYSNEGAMTPGPTQETADDMSMEKIETIIDAMRHERYRFSPVRRIYIPKKSGSCAPRLAVVVGQAGRRSGPPAFGGVLRAAVFRPLARVPPRPRLSHRLAGDSQRLDRDDVVHRRGYFRLFRSLDHEVMLSILSEKIHDGRFLRLIGNMLSAGYLEDWQWNATLSGAPQGGVVSPVLSNIYLHKLDQFVETVLIPQYTQGKAQENRTLRTTRRTKRWCNARKAGDRAKVRELRQQLRRLPVGDPCDPGYRRLRYSRYADDHLLGFTGPKAEAEKIKGQLAVFLHDELKLELSAEKTLITHARTHAARYLGYEIIVQHEDSKITGGQRSANGKVALRVPLDVIKAKRAPYLRHGKPWHRSAMQNLDDYDIVKTYGAEYRGIVQYYLLANDVWRLNRLGWDAETSMLKTLAAKHQSTVAKMAARHKAKVETPYGLRTCFEARVERPGKQPLVARFGGIPLVWTREMRSLSTVFPPTRSPTRGKSWSAGS